ncbi:MAG: hypothetical protein IJY56_00150 [Clostridia bacterium]|nr:hypothetical protein [Clostridia bacterium]
MKQFAKSLVSVVIALSILATMCVVGISVIAKVHEFVLVSETATKNKTDLKTTKDGGVTVGTVDVVNTSTLGTPPAGAPATAYKFTIANAKDGVHFTAPSDDASALSAKTTELVFDAWIYVSDVSKCGNLLFRMYGSAGPQAGGNGNIEGYVWQGSVSGAAMSAKTGWNHVQVPMTFDNGWQTKDPATALNAYKSDMKITGISLHDHSLAASNSYDVAVASIKLTYDDGVIDVVEKEFADFTADTKVLDDYHKTRVNADEELSLVDVSTLTKGDVKYAGPSTNAVKVDLSKVDSSVYTGRKGGVYTSLETPVRFNGDGKEADYVFDAWLYYEGTSNILIIQIYGAGYETKANENNSVEYWPYRYILKDLKEGWNHIVLTLDKFTKTKESDNGLQKEGLAAMQREKTITGISFHEDQFSNCTKYTYAVADLVLCHKDYAADANKVPEKDSNKSGITVVSANVDKKVEDMVAVGSANMSVVKTSTLKGGTAGVPSEDAYMVTDAAQQTGFKVPVVNPDWSAPATSLNSAQTHALKGYGLNMWIWISDATKVGTTFVARFCEEGKNTGGLSNWTYQMTSALSGTAGSKITWQTGWNNVTFWLPDTGDFDHRTNMNSDGKTIAEVIFEDHKTTGSYSFAVACARLVKGQAEADAGWGIGSGTGDAVDVAMIVVAILLAAMAASVTVYFGKKAR